MTTALLLLIPLFLAVLVAMPLRSRARANRDKRVAERDRADAAVATVKAGRSDYWTKGRSL